MIENTDCGEVVFTRGTRAGAVCKGPVCGDAMSD